MLYLEEEKNGVLHMGTIAMWALDIPPGVN